MYASPSGGVIGMRGRDDSVYWDAVCKRRLPAFSWLTHHPPPPPLLNRDSPRIWSTMKIAFAGKTDYLKIIDFRPTPNSLRLLRPLARQVRWWEKGIKWRISDSSFGPRTGVILLFPWVVNIDETMKEKGRTILCRLSCQASGVSSSTRSEAFPLLFSQKQNIVDGLVSSSRVMWNSLRHACSLTKKIICVLKSNNYFNKKLLSYDIALQRSIREYHFIVKRAALNYYVVVNCTKLISIALFYANFIFNI